MSILVPDTLGRSVQGTQAWIRVSNAMVAGDQEPTLKGWWPAAGSKEACKEACACDAPLVHPNTIRHYSAPAHGYIRIPVFAYICIYVCICLHICIYICVSTYVRSTHLEGLVAGCKLEEAYAQGPDIKGGAQAGQGGGLQGGIFVGGEEEDLGGHVGDLGGRAGKGQREGRGEAGKRWALGGGGREDI